MIARTFVPVSVLLLVSIAVPPLPAQAHRAIILGQVTDRTGAAVPNAPVKVIQTETNVTSKTASNESGNFEVPGLLPGTYRVEATARGFKEAVVEGIVLTAAKRAEVNLLLDIGDVAESVTVKSERELLDTASADTNVVIDQRKLTDLPVGEANVTYLYFLAAGAHTASGVALGTSVGNDVMPMQRAGTSTSRFNGSPAGTSEFTIDGSPNMQEGNASAGGGVAFNPSPDMVEEVRVQTTTFDASVGHSGGATVDVILKSGTNQLHGTASDYFRSKDWNANSWAGNRGGTPRQDFQYKLWGFTAGGPVRLGPLYNGKDRTFFFIGFESWSSLSPNPPGFVTIPTPQQLQGDFSGLLRLGSQYQVYDPDSGQLLSNGRIQRTPFPGNIIPTNRVNPISASFAKLWPQPNAPGGADGQLNFTYVNEPFPRTLWALPMRFDHVLTRSQRLFVRLLTSNTKLPRSGEFTDFDISVWKINSDDRELALGDVVTFGPGFVGDFRGSVKRFTWNTLPIGTELGYGDFGLDSLSKYLDHRLSGIPNISVSGYSAFTNPQGAQQVSEVRDAAAHFTRVIGAHSLKFGADMRWYIDNRGSNDQATISFSGAYSRGPLDNSPAPPVGVGLADFLLGRFASAQINQPSKAANLSTYQGIYLQDDWKVSPRLTLNVGVRYEREGPATERFNRNLAGFDFGAANPIAAQARAQYAANPIPGFPADQFQVRGGILFAGVNGNPRTIYDANNRNFAPRVGLAYQLNNNTVLRAGYGLYFIPYGQRFFANTGGVPGFDTNTFAFSTQDGLNFTRPLDNLFPNGLTPPAGSSAGLATFLGQSINVPALRRNPSAYNQRWQFSIQRRFRSAYRLEARYVGNHTVRMPVARNVNALANQFLSTSPERDQARIDYLSTRVANPFLGIPGVGGNLGSASVVGYSDLLTPYPQFTNINVQNPQGASWYQALQTEFERQFSGGFTFQTSYTWSKTLDALSYLNPADPKPEKVIADIDHPHIWRFLGVWELPFGRGKRWASGLPLLADRLLGGWQVQAISFIESGYPIPFGNVLFRGDIKAIGAGPISPDRMFNVDAGFERSTALQLQSNVRTFPSRLTGVRTDPQINTDFSLIKATRIRERLQVQFRAEAYNLFNQYFIQGAIDTNPVSKTFGTTVAASGPRTVQLGIRGSF